MTMAKSPKNKMAQYIGDGAYAAINDGDTLVLTTENGISAQNTIYIDAEIYPILENFIKRVRETNERWKE